MSNMHKHAPILKRAEKKADFDGPEITAAEFLRQEQVMWSHAQLVQYTRELYKYAGQKPTQMPPLTEGDYDYGYEVYYVSVLQAVCDSLEHFDVRPFKWTVNDMGR